LVAGGIHVKVVDNIIAFLLIIATIIAVAYLNAKGTVEANPALALILIIFVVAVMAYLFGFTVGFRHGSRTPKR
jgi:predicted membrane channel-forming protein YqfA (hemolysin III family)